MSMGHYFQNDFQSIQPGPIVHFHTEVTLSYYGNSLLTTAIRMLQELFSLEFLGVYISPISRVFGPYCKLRTEFFFHRFIAQARSARAINRWEKTRIRNLQYGPKKMRLIRCLLYDFFQFQVQDARFDNHLTGVKKESFY